MTSPCGRLITVEGGEGVGKSTNIAFIRGLIEKAGISLVVSREPGGTPLAEDIRKLLLTPRDERMADVTELLLIIAARVQHLENLILPSLSQGKWVLCDRFIDATIAYQGAGRGIDIGLIDSLNRLLLPGISPDLTLLLDMPIDQGQERVNSRGGRDRFEQEQTEFFVRVRNTYLTLAQREPDRFRIIDASQSLAAVQESIAAVLEPILRDTHVGT